MPLLRSAGGLFRAVNKKADALIGAAAGVLCLPSIIAGSGDILKSFGTMLKNGALTFASGLVLGSLRLIENIIQDKIDQVIGNVATVINKFVKLLSITTLIAMGIRGFINSLIAKANAALSFIKDGANCKYAAATLLRCMTAQIVQEINLDKKLAIDISKGVAPLDKLTNKITKSLSKPTGAIQRFTNKTAADIDRATAVIETSNIF